MNLRRIEWLCALLALAAVAWPYWQLPYARLSIEALWNGSLGLVAALSFVAFWRGDSGPWRIACIVGGAVPAAVMLRVVGDGLVDASRHNLWPLELAIAIGIGLAAGLAGTLPAWGLRRLRG